jgi:hypothetical protein
MVAGVDRVLENLRGLPRWQFIEKILLIAVLLDLALGGNGYLFKIFGFRLREIFFVLCLAWAILRLTVIEPVRPDRTLIWISTAFALVTAFGAAFGYVNGNRVGAIIAEIKPLAYFPMLLFFLVAIRTRADAGLVALLLAGCGALLAVLYGLTIIFVQVGLLDYLGVYELLRSSDEFIFRFTPGDSNETFVGFLYKGTVYVCVAALFLIFDPFRRTKMLAAIAVFAVGMTITRGLCFSLVVSIVLGCMVKRDWARIPLRIGMALMLLGILFAAQKVEDRAIQVGGDGFLFGHTGNIIATSGTVLSAHTGLIALPIQAGRDIKKGERLRIANTGTLPPTKIMVGTVASYDPASSILLLDADDSFGNDKPDDLWIVSRTNTETAAPPSSAPSPARSVATSAVARPVTMGRMTFLIGPQLGFQPGQRLRVFNTVLPPTKVMVGNVISYDRARLVLDIDTISGDRTPDNYWLIAIDDQSLRALSPATTATSHVNSAPAAGGSGIVNPQYSAVAGDAQNSRAAGDNLRVSDIKYVLENASFVSSLVGHGLGAPIQARDRTENNYLEIFHKQGLLGLSIWGALLIYTARVFFALSAGHKDIGLPFFLSSLFVYIATASNTFLTGSTGMAVVFISLASLIALVNDRRASSPSSDWYGAGDPAALATAIGSPR